MAINSPRTPFRNTFIWLGVPLSILLALLSFFLWFQLHEIEMYHIRAQLFDTSAVLANPAFNEKVERLIAGEVAAKKTMDQVFQGEFGRKYGMAIYKNGAPIYAAGGQVANPFFIQQTSFKNTQNSGIIYFWPTKELIENLLTPLPLVVLLSGIAASILTLLLFYLYNLARANSKSMQLKTHEAETSAAYSKRILQTVKEGFITIDADSCIKEWNPYAEQIFGWSREEALNQKIYELIIPKDYQEMHKKGVERFLKTGEAKVFDKAIEVPAKHKRGHEFPIELIVFPLKGDNSYSFHAFIRDITLRKRAEADQARLVSIIEASDDAIISMDLEGNIFSWNEGAENLYGHKMEEMIGKNISIIHLPENLHILRNILTKISNGEHVLQYDAERKHKDGHVIPVSASITPMRDKNGNIIGASSITRDISASKNIEKMKNEFISIVSHELRTPLTSIRGSLGILASEKLGALTSKAKQLVEIANSNSERLIRLINDILDIEKIEAGKMDFNFKNIEVNKLIQDVTESNQSLAEKYNVQIQFKVNNPFEIQGDTDRLTQALTNLLSNAIRFSPSGEIVKISAEEVNDQVRIAVSNKGSVIPKEFQNKIFSKFSQADSSDSRAKGGTGLGLNISKAIVEKHAGKIYFTSAANEGTTFYIELPLYDSSQKVDVPEEEDKINILICDANFDSADYIKSLLEEKNIHADIANSSKEAKSLIEKNHYQAITVDLTLPDEDGITFIKQLRSHPSTKNIPVIVISVHAEEGKALLNGDLFPVVDWIEKPLSKEQARKILSYINANYGDRKPNVLSVEDDNDVTQVLRLLLHDRATVWSANNVESAKQLLKTQAFDLVILDLNLPDDKGTALLPCINYLTKQAIPVIVFSVDELDQKYTHLVKEALLKSKVTNEQLFKSIETAINTKAEV